MCQCIETEFTKLLSVNGNFIISNRPIQVPLIISINLIIEYLMKFSISKLLRKSNDLRRRLFVFTYNL
jgi:hypothetical protein